MTERVKLTEPQRKFLARLEGRPFDAPVTTELVGFAATMAERLEERGFVDRYFRGFGQWALRITPAGRQALKDPQHD